MTVVGGAVGAVLPRVTREVRREPPGEGTVMASYALNLLSALLLLILVNVAVISQVQHVNQQHHLYGELRVHLAEGSVPIGQTGVDGHLVRPGAPVALLRISSLHVNEVVVEGTSSSETAAGVGHRRDTPLPGQAGVSVLMGRAAAYGGVFRHLGHLRPGEEFTVQTGQGVATYRVIGARGPHTKLPQLLPGDGRLTLITASGYPFLPSGVLRIDAELVSKAFPAPARVLPPNGIRSAEQALRGDTSHAFALSWLALLLVVLSVATVWAWKSWSRSATWVVAFPILGVVALAVADDLGTFLPNLI